MSILKDILETTTINSRKVWQQIYLHTSHNIILIFHPQAFDAQCAVTLVGNIRGLDIRRQYEDMLLNIKNYT